MADDLEGSLGSCCWSLCPKSVGDTVLVTGSSCGFPCEGGGLRGYLLSEDHEVWHEVDWPERVTVDSETEFVPTATTDAAAAISVAGRHYAIDEAGSVTSVPQRPFSSVAACDLGDRLVQVPIEVVPPEQQPPLDLERIDVWPLQHRVAGAADLLVLGVEDPEWERSASAPPAFVTGSSSHLCGENTMTLIGLGPDLGRELVYSSADDSWTIRASNYVELAGSSRLPATWEDLDVSSPDGSTVFVVVAEVGRRRLLSRAGDGPWIDTVRSPLAVYATDEGVYTVDLEVGADLVRIWPT